MDILEIVFGDSCYKSMQESSLGKNEILMFNVLFNVGDLSNIDDYKIGIPEDIIVSENNYNFEKEFMAINSAIKNKKKIRVWTSHYNVYSYLIMLYVSSIVKENNYDLYVLYSDFYEDDFVSPSLMNSKELEELSLLECKLTKDEIDSFSQVWKKLVEANSDMRVQEGNVIKSVSIDYYDNFILNKLKQLGKSSVSSLVAFLMSEVYLIDIFYVYLISRLVKAKKIRIVSTSPNRVFDNIVEVV